MGDAIGGFVFQWADGWWKYQQNTHLSIHDTDASWANGGYKEDYVQGENNMNEEWWGICAKGPANAEGLYPLYPRTAYYALQDAFRLPAYGPGITRAKIDQHFDAVVPSELAYHYQAEKAQAGVARLELAHVSMARLDFSTYSTGGNKQWDWPGVPGGGHGFDHMESAYLGVTVNPTSRVTGDLQLNVLGNVAQNPLDELFYERAGRPIPVYTRSPDPYDPAGQRTLESFQDLPVLSRVRIYKASLTWDSDYFKVNGFYRTGHYHWADEGDVFGLYREANYGANADIYDANVPIGLEVEGKRALSGLKLAFGPQLWWGANPTVLAKYRLALGRSHLTLLHEEDLAAAGATGLSSAAPELATRKTELAFQTRLYGFGVELAGLWSGSTLIGRSFLDPENRPQQVKLQDTFGARAKVTFERGPWHWYAQGAYMGLVADAAPDPRVTFTGWTLKDSGSGNQVNAMTGLAVNLGMFQIGPNLLWQRPLVGPGHSITNIAASRNIDADPFVVRGNRETQAAELMLVFDPTPATWMWQWDNDLQENAPIAVSLDLVYRHQPTATDAGTFYAPDGTTRFAFPAGVPAADVYELHLRAVSAPVPGLRLVLHAWAGNEQSTGNSTRQPHRYGFDFTLGWHALQVSGFAKFNDWGPYDYYRDFNLTFPLQLMADVSYTLGPVRWLWQQQTKIGIRVMDRYLNGYSGGRYVQNPNDPTTWGEAYEIPHLPVLEPVMAARSLLALALAAALGSGCAHRPAPFASAAGPGPGIDYGPFRAGQRPGGPGPTRAQLRQDLHLLAHRFHLVRLYASDGPTPVILSVISEDHLPLEVLLGAWIAPEPGAAARAANAAQVHAALRLARAHPGIVVGLLVGNETRVSWSSHRVREAVLLHWLEVARRGSRLPVATADDYLYWLTPESDRVAARCDFLVTHVYAMWHGKQVPDGIAFTRRRYQAVRRRHPGLPVLLGEVGWATDRGTGGDQGRLIHGEASEAAQRRFYRDWRRWVVRDRIPSTWFEAFDEPWKGGANPHDVEKHWGLWRADRSPKAALAPTPRSAPAP